MAYKEPHKNDPMKLKHYLLHLESGRILSFDASRPEWFCKVFEGFPENSGLVEALNRTQLIAEMKEKGDTELSGAILGKIWQFLNGHGIPVF